MPYLKIKTQVAIIGSGPSGLFLSEILHQHGIESVVIEKQTREHVLSRQRAGVLQQRTIDLLTLYGLGKSLAEEGIRHGGFNMVWGNNNLFINIAHHTNQQLTTYAQSKIQEDLFNAADRRKAMIMTNVTNVRLMQVDAHSPYIVFNHKNTEILLTCDFIAGCDGYHGISRSAIPDKVQHRFKKEFPFAWLGLLSETTPLSTITYASHPRGFALASIRNPMLSRYYLQVPVNTKLEHWSDNDFWYELKMRFPGNIAERIIEGPSIEKSITRIKCFVVTPMQYGRLFLVGDAAHIFPPTGAQGLNLAMADAFYLSRALTQFYTKGSRVLLDAYSSMAVNRAWCAMSTALYLTNLLHSFKMDNTVQQRALMYLQSSHQAQRNLAMRYAGLNSSVYTAGLTSGRGASRFAS